MVTQSLVPFMEGRVMTWNDQVASRRRGIGGRFMSLSKRWTNFGAPKGTGATTMSSPSSAGSNFNSQHGYYPPETPEATMRQMADYAFMLRDWRLAYNTYDLLRADFASDKAWAYHASASELAAVSLLLLPQGTNSKTTSEAVDQHIEAALFSYLTRCSMPSGAIRCLIMTIELLMSRGSRAAENASTWAIKMLELGILTPLAQAFLIERVADCHQCQGAADHVGLHQRKRQIAFWNVLASQSWAKLEKPSQASARLKDARAIYGSSPHNADSLPFPSMHSLLKALDLEIQSMMQGDLIDLHGDPVRDDGSQNEYEQSEQLNLPARRYSNVQAGDLGGFSSIGASHPDSDGLL